MVEICCSSCLAFSLNGILGVGDEDGAVLGGEEGEGVGCAVLGDLVGSLVGALVYAFFGCFDRCICIVILCIKYGR